MHQGQSDREAGAEAKRGEISKFKHKFQFND